MWKERYNILERTYLPCILQNYRR